jgi:hypothetical protein
MKKNYDFSKAVKNPYATRMKRELIRQVDAETIANFQNMAKDLAIPYQTPKCRNRIIRTVLEELQPIDIPKQDSSDLIF